MTVNGEMERVIKDFHGAGKPLALCCISPIIAAKVTPGIMIMMTVD